MYIVSIDCSKKFRYLVSLIAAGLKQPHKYSYSRQAASYLDGVGLGGNLARPALISCTKQCSSVRWTAILISTSSSSLILLQYLFTSAVLVRAL